MGVMAISTYGDLCPGSRRVGMMLRNLSAWEVRIPPKTVIGNVQMAEIVPNMKALKHTSEVLPSKEQKEPSQVSWPTCLNSPKKELTWPDLYISTVGTGCSDLENMTCWKSGSLGVHQMGPQGSTRGEKNLKEICRCLC